MPTRTGLLSLTAVVGLLLVACSGGAQSPTEVADPPAQPAPSRPATAQSTTAQGTTGQAPRDAAATTTVEDAPAEVSIAFVGDVMLGRSIGERILDGRDPFAGVAGEFVGQQPLLRLRRRRHPRHARPARRGRPPARRCRSRR